MKSPPTRREREIFQLLADGHTEAEIAKVLYLSPSTVHTHVRNALKRMGYKNRTHAAVELKRMGLIE